jgi:hypothetical protein
MARLAPAVVEPLAERARVAQEELDRDQARAQERVAKLEAAARAARAEPRAPETDAIREVKIARADAELRWQRVLVEVARWRGAAAQAASERQKVDLLTRAGQDVDVEPFNDQNERLRAGLSDATRRAAAERARFDELDRKLNAQKALYAQAHGAAH